MRSHQLQEGFLLNIKLPGNRQKSLRSEKVFDLKKAHKPVKVFKFEGSRLYYSKEFERSVLFIFTLIMLVLGFLLKLDIL